MQVSIDGMEHNDLEVLLRSRIPLIAVESRDETEVLKALTRACTRFAGTPATPAHGLDASAGLPLFQWTVTDGLKRLDVNVGAPQRTLTEPIEILKHVRATGLAGSYALLDFHPYLHDSTLVRFLKDIAQEYTRCARTIVLISYAIEIPHEIEHLIARCVLALPDRNERRQIVEDVARQWMRDNARQSIKVDRHALALLVGRRRTPKGSRAKRSSTTVLFSHLPCLH
jgi:hypothetical protein